MIFNQIKKNLNTLNTDFNMQQIFNTRVFYLITIIVFYSMGYLAFHVHPSFDDYAWPVFIRERGILETQRFAYTELNGRYFSTIISTLTMSEFYFHVKYKFFIFSYIILYFIAIYRFSSIVLISSNTKKNKSTIITTAGVLAFIILLIIPESSSMYFWLTGSIVYLSTVIIFLFFISELEIYYTNYDNTKNTSFVIICILLFAIPLFSEIGYFTVLPILIYQTVLKIFKYKNWDLKIIFTLFLMTIAMLINYYGSKIRMEKLNILTHNLDFKNAILITYHFICNFLISTQFIILITGNIILHLFLKQYNIRRTAILSITSFIPFIVIGIITFSLSYYTSALILGVNPPKRVLNLLYITFQIFITMAMVVYNSKKIENSSNSIYITIIVLVIACLLPSNFRQMIGDILKGKAKNYDIFMQKRYETTMKAQTDTVFLDDINYIDKPISIMFNTGGDLTKSKLHSNWYYNEYYSKLFNIKSVYIK